MQLPPSTCKGNCECAASICIQCEHPIGIHMHYRDAERLNFFTMEFDALGPVHRACLKYMMMGVCPDHTRRFLAAEALAN